VGGVPAYSYTWSVSVSGSSTLSSLSPGEYGLTVTDANGCSFEKSFLLVEPEWVIIDLGPDQTMNLDEEVKIELNTNVPENEVSLINWSEYNGMSCSGCTAFEFIASFSATISAMIIDTSGCAASDSMKLKVITPMIIYVPTVFSPNSDGVNDYFTISGKRNLINIASLRIFDRWGNQLFDGINLEPGNTSMGWDGTFREKSMQPGVYVFVAELEYDNAEETIWGDITILK
jgi:gliding motility-associated-like protein